MRHRILDVINLSLKEDTVAGIVEIDEFFIHHSYKGNHSKNPNFVMPREPRKRGKSKNDKKKRGISNEIVGFFDGKLGKDITFVVDSHKSYIGIKKDLNIELKQVPIGKSMLDSV